MLKITDYTGSCRSDIITFAAQRLGIADAELIINYGDKLLDRFGSTKYDIDAILYKTIVPGKFQLVVRQKPHGKIENLLLHEMVHLSQYVSGDLSLDLDSNIYTWKGQAYGPEIEYRKRPWEVEAFSMASKLEKEWKVARRNNTINV